MRKLHFFSILVALFFATTTLWATPSVAVNGKLPGAFSVACGKQVYFSQGNLQYTISTNTWSFMDEQYSRAEGGSVGNNYANRDVVSHFGWGTSGWNNIENDPTSVHYQPYTTCNSNHGTTDNPYQYGPSNANVIGNTDYASAENWSKEVAGTRPCENYDWGVKNSSNLGAGWRTPTAGEWKYLLQGRTNYYNLRTYATVNNVKGMIILPDDWSLPAGLEMTITISNFTTNNYDDNKWKLLEGAGAVFLPSAGYRNNMGVGYVDQYAYYWSSSAYDANNAYCLDFYSSGVDAVSHNLRYFGFSVRLVQDVPDGLTIIPVADVENPPTARTGLVYNGGGQELIIYGSNVIPNTGILYYRILPSEDWVTSWSYLSLRAASAGTYTVQWYIDADGSCYQNSEVKSIEVTIDKASFTSTPAQPVTPAASWTYDNITRDLLTPQTITSPSGCTIQYSTDGGETWSTTIPQGHDAGTYTVQYKVVRNSNYYDYIPSTNNPFTVVVSKASYTPTGDYSVAANALTYIPNTPQQLVSVTGSVTNGTIYYKVGDGDWSTEIPTATTAGAYSVSYKVVPTDPNYEEYVPAASPIAVNIEKANIDLSGVTLPVSPSTIPYEGTPQNLIEIDPVADCTIWYKLGEGDWTTTPPAATDAANYSVQYKIVPDDSNYNTYGPETVTVTIVDYPTITDQTADDATIASILTGLTDPWQLKVKRIIYADGEYNTICLPFAVSASDLANDQYPLYGYERLKTLKGAKVTGSGKELSIDIFVEDVDHMDAGVPYLISYPSAHADIVNPIFQLSSTTTFANSPSAVSVDGVTFQGMFAQVHIDPYTNERDRDYLFLGANSQLMWPKNDDASYMSGLRAYFIIDRTVITPAAAPSGTRARFVNAPKQPTAIENTELNTQAQKLLENGQLIILKNGIKYNAQGQVLK